MPAQSFGLPTAGIKQAALHNDRSNNRNSWTASVTHKLTELGSLWSRQAGVTFEGKLSFIANMDIQYVKFSNKVQAAGF